MSGINIVFLGTPDFAVPSLAVLCENGYNVIGVFTQPDRPKGRGGAVVFSPVKEYAISRGIPVFQPEKIRAEEPARVLRELAPDLMVTAAFGQILSEENLAVPRLGCVNVHASLLPKYRGSSPIQWAIARGETQTGVTTMYTDAGVDTGDMILQNKLDILPEETAGELFDRLAELGARTLLQTVKLIEEGKAPRVPQDHAQATHFPMLNRENAFLDFDKPARELCCFVRAMNPWPVAWCRCGGDILKVYAAHTVEKTSDCAPGTVLAADAKNGLLVACGDGVVSLDQIQLPGKRVMDAKTFFVGNRLPDTLLTP